jgi:hypothetical protein
MTVTADGRRRGERLSQGHAARLTVMDPLARASRTSPSVATGGPDPLRQVIWLQPDPTGGPASSPRITLHVEPRR